LVNIAFFDDIILHGLIYGAYALDLVYSKKVPEPCRCDAQTPCRNFGDHLRRIWGHLDVIAVKRIDDPNKAGLLGLSLDTRNFKQRTHEVLIQCKAKRNAFTSA
jgi:hypothetical protein